MNKVKVGIEQNLNNVIRYLKNNDVSVEVLENSNKRLKSTMKKYDAIVVSGTDVNLMGMQDIISNAKVINASGMSPEEIYTEIINTTK